MACYELESPLQLFDTGIFEDVLSIFITSSILKLIQGILFLSYHICIWIYAMYLSYVDFIALMKKNNLHLFPLEYLHLTQKGLGSVIMFQMVFFTCIFLIKSKV